MFATTFWGTLSKHKAIPMNDKFIEFGGPIKAKSLVHGKQEIVWQCGNRRCNVE
jgi:hypothetical protein